MIIKRHQYVIFQFLVIGFTTGLIKEWMKGQYI